MAGNLSSDDDLISQINVTPLVDVVLVLLIVFMITAPVIYQSAIKVNLPSASTGQQGKSQSPLTFTLSETGELFWGKEQLDWSGLDRKLASLKDLDKEESAVINADEKTGHGMVIRLLDTLRKHGLTRIALTVKSN